MGLHSKFNFRTVFVADFGSNHKTQVHLPFLIQNYWFFRGNVYDANVPPLSDFLIIWPMILVEDTWFYLTHRMLHTKLFYEKIHKFHHKWVQPTALSVFYMHPFEFIMAIVINIYIGYWVTGCHTAIFHAYLLVESWKGLMNHRLPY